MSQQVKLHLCLFCRPDNSRFAPSCLGGTPTRVERCRWTVCLLRGQCARSRQEELSGMLQTRRPSEGRLCAMEILDFTASPWLFPVLWGPLFHPG